MYNQKPLLGTLPNYAHPLTPNVAAWIMNEGSGDKIYDIINGNHGTFGAGTAAPTWKPGRRGPALDFNGNNDIINCGSNPLLDDISPLSIVTWVYWRGEGTSTQEHIVDKGSYNSVEGFFFFVYDGDDSLRFYQYFSTVNGYWQTPADSIPKNVWTQVALIYPGRTISDKPTMYINGVSKTITTIYNPEGTVKSDASLNLTIGDTTDLGRPFDGIIDEVMICNWALSAGEIWQLYIDSYCWLAEPYQAELYAAPAAGVMSPYYYEQLMAGGII